MIRTNKMMYPLFALTILYGAMPAARAEPVVLGPAQMDAVTAGYATGGALALAAGAFVMTGTSATAVNTMTTLNGNPTLAGYAAGSEAVGSSTAVGPGAATGTSATTSATVPGTEVMTYSIGMNRQYGPVSMSGSATMSFGSFAGPQISF